MSGMDDSFSEYEEEEQSDDEPMPEEEDGSDHETISDLDSDSEESSIEEPDWLVTLKILSNTNSIKHCRHSTKMKFVSLLLRQNSVAQRMPKLLVEQSLSFA